MRFLVMAVAGLLLSGGWVAGVEADRPNLTGKWKLDQAHSKPGQADKDLVLFIEDKGQDIHMSEARGPNPKTDVSDFTCGTMGKECSMMDAGEKAAVSVYHRDRMLVVLKTHGRKGSAVEKRRFSLSPGGDLLTVEVIPIVPEGESESLVFTRTE